MVGGTEMDDLVVGILKPANFEWQKERCEAEFEAEFVKELDLNE